MDYKYNKDPQEDRNQQDHQDSQDQHESKENDHPFKKVAMATFGAISNAVEKVAEVIGEATTKEKIDDYAKKGEESIAAVKEKSGEVFKQVKDLSSQTVERVKSTMVDEDLKELKDVAATKHALIEELSDLKKTASQAELRLQYAHTEEEYEEFKEQVSKDLGSHKSKVEGLIKHMINIHKEVREDLEKVEAEKEKEEEKLLNDLKKQQDKAENGS